MGRHDSVDPRSATGTTTRRRADEKPLRDARYGMRLLLRKPGVTAVAIITFALGIGANTAIFTVDAALLLKPLPYDHPERLVLVNENNLSRGWTSFSVLAARTSSIGALRAKSFEALAAYGGRSFNYTGGRGTRAAARAVRHPGLPRNARRHARHGRGFRPDEFEPGKGFVVILGPRILAARCSAAGRTWSTRRSS